MASLSIYKLLYQQTWFYELKIVYEWPKKNQHYYPNCVLEMLCVFCVFTQGKFNYLYLLITFYLKFKNGRTEKLWFYVFQLNFLVFDLSRYM